MSRPEFSEREYEFSFNMEFLRTYSSGTVITPVIPSQRREGSLGYDVKFDITRGSFTTSMFFQHKVSSFASRLTGRNGRFYGCHGGPYYRFPLTKLSRSQQHNLLVSLVDAGHRVFYSAPAFHTSLDLQSGIVRDQILKSSVFVNPKSIGHVADLDTHQITYDPGGKMVYSHSEPREVGPALTWNQLLQPIGEVSISLEYLRHFADQLERIANEQTGTQIETPRPSTLNGLVRYIATILVARYDLGWMLLT